MSFGDLSSELAGYLPGVSGYLTQDWIKRSWRKIRDARLWSFLITDDAVVCPTALNQGTYAITQFNNQVTADATASAAFATLSPGILPPQFLQLRFMGAATTSQIYNIRSVDTSTPTAFVFTLDRVVMEATNPTSSYLCYRNYVAAPVSDFLRWLSFVDMVNGYDLVKDGTSWNLDSLDPQRQSLGTAYHVASYQYSEDPVPVPMYELWPGPTQGQSFYVRYRRRGTDFTNPNDVQPDMIPDDLILHTALCTYAYPWAAANQGSFPHLKGTNWHELIRSSRREVYGGWENGQYIAGMLRDAIRQDDNAFMQSVFNRGHGLRDGQSYPWPIDASFLSSHLVPL